MRIFRQAQRPVRAHHLEAVIPIGQALDAFGLELGEKPFAERTVGDPAKRLPVGKDIRKVKYFEFLDAERTKLGKRRRQHLHGAELQSVEFLFVLVENRIVIDLDLHSPVRIFFREFLEPLRRLALGRVRRHHMAVFDDDGIHRPRGRRNQQRAKRRREKEFAHDSLLKTICP
jgi:hypothetical protein